VLLPESSEETFEVYDLPRGGQVVVWGQFIAQIAAYPETIKDTMGQSHGVPQVYILPERLFDITLGVSRSEIEFPIYFNFYLNQRKTIIVCRREQMRAVMRVLREAIFGPANINVVQDYAPGIEPADIAKEMAYFKQDPNKPGGKLKIKDLVEFHLFDENNEVVVRDVQITLVGLDRYRFTTEGKVRELSFRPPPKAPPVSTSTRRYRPPFYGVTVIGSGHGFDPSADTSGFIIWVNGRGILVDPPVDTTQWLRLNGVDSRLISDLVLTHCHADHDAGTLQKLLEEGRVRLHTTATIIDSFVRKYRGLLGLTGNQLRALFDFVPVTVNEPVNIAGANFFFRYNFHPIPTLGFSTTFQGKTFAYSGDHLNDAKYLQKLHESGLINKTRLDDLLEFEWDADLILHEAGVPPIHTPVEALVALPQDVKERLYVNHISVDKIPRDSGLKLAQPGVRDTLKMKVNPPELWLAQRMLDLFSGVDLFWNLPVMKVAEFLRIAKYRKYHGGEALVRTGEPGNEFYLILSGEAEVVQKGEFLTRLGRYDYFGEIAVLLGSERTADILAYTEMEVLTVSARDFLRFVGGTEIDRTLRLVAESRLHEGWPLMNENSLLAKLSIKQKTQLIPYMRQRTIPADRLLFRKGDRIRCLYLIKEGQVRLTRAEGHETRGYRGTLVGRVRTEGERHTVSAETESTTVVYVISMADLNIFFRENPGTHVRFLAAERGQITETL
jgi:CRP-like cAMP-binding protein/phosphoribosyl 1,2-cyclic phosphodiesterase